MNANAHLPGRTARGALLILGAIAWGVGCGLILQLFLPRALTPTVYARYAVAVSVIVWLEAVGSSLIVRACTQYAASRGEDWQDVVRSGLFLSLTWGGILAAALMGTAPLVAGWLGDETLVPLLRIFAVDAPLFCSMTVLLGVLQGRQKFAARATGTICYWSSKVILTVAFVSGGLSEVGAIIGSILASVVGVAVGYSQTGRLPRPSGPLLRKIVLFGLPVGIAVITQKFVTSVDLWTLQALSPEPEAAGYYAIAQYAASIPFLLAMAVTSSSIPALVRAWEGNDRASLRGLVHGQHRFLLILSAPLLIIVLTDGPALFAFLFSAPYAEAARAARFLVPGTALVAMGFLSANVLFATGRSWRVVFAVGAGLGLQILLLALLGPGGDPALIATATFISGGFLAIVQTAQVYAVAGFGPAFGTALRVALATGSVWALSLLWHPEGALILLKGAAIGIGFVALLLLLREVRWEEARSLFRRGG